MQQQFQATPTYLMHISQDLRCNKVFVKQRRVYAPGLACVTEKVSSTETPRELDLTSSPLMDEPPPKIDQHKPSHSRMHYT
jgi:hypothetical protein